MELGMEKRSELTGSLLGRSLRLLGLRWYDVFREEERYSFIYIVVVMP